MKKAVILIVGMMLAGCASTRPLPVANGPVRQLNIGHWMPNTNELTEPPK